jgi:hypothetical protein
MQAFRVSKSPPRALYLVIALALGAVAGSAAILPAAVPGGLGHNPTFLRLLGFQPAATGTALSAQSVGDARAGQTLLIAAAVPGPTPAPPTVTAQVAPPSAAPANATTAPATAADKNPDPVGVSSPALQEINDTAGNITTNPIDSSGLGVLPADAGNVSGAPDLAHFIDPTVNESACTWTQEVTSFDANHDGHPESAEIKMLGTCTFTRDGVVVAGATVARDISVWDNDSSGVYNALEIRQGIEAYAGPLNGTYEYRAKATWTLSVKDADEDGKPEVVRVTFAGEQDFDRNANGNAELVRTVTAHLDIVRNVSADVPNTADVALRVYQAYDLHDDGQHEYQGVLEIAAHTVDVNHDGRNETANVSVVGYESLDRDQDGHPELARGVDFSLNASNPESLANPTQTDLRLYLYGWADPTGTGVIEYRKALEVTGHATDSNGDGHPELVQLGIHAAALRNVSNEQPQVNATLDGTYTAYDNDSDGIVEKATLHLQAEALVVENGTIAHAYATLDALVVNDIPDANPELVEAHLVATETIDTNGDGIPEETRGLTIDFLAADANSNGHAEYANLTVHATDVVDTNHDGVPEVQASFDAYVQSTDLNDDGHPEYVNVTARGSVVQRAENGTLEMTASITYDARYVDADSSGIFENVTVTLRAEKTVYGPDGSVASREWITYDYSGQDVNQDGTMDNVSLVFEKHVVTGA